MFFSELVGPTLGRVAILDARGRSHMCDQVTRPLLDQGAGGRSPGFLAIGSHQAMTLTPPEILEPIRRQRLAWRPLSLLPRRKLRQQVRPVPSDNAAYFVTDGRYGLEAFLDLPAAATPSLSPTAIEQFR